MQITSHETRAEKQPIIMARSVDRVIDLPRTGIVSKSPSNSSMQLQNRSCASCRFEQNHSGHCSSLGVKKKHTQTSLFAWPNGYKAGLITTLRYLIFIRARFITTGGAQGRNASQGFGINPKYSDGYRQKKIHMDVALADLVAKALQLKMLLLKYYTQMLQSKCCG